MGVEKKCVYDKISRLGDKFRNDVKDKIALMGGGGRTLGNGGCVLLTLI